MDIVSATFNNTILPTGMNSDEINILLKVGHNKEANMMRIIQYVSTRVDTGGALSTERKAESKTEQKPRPKRLRFRLRRTNVSKSVNKMAGSVLKKKVQYLDNCIHVG